jgi:DNA-binding transcriptional LysR family regulator
VAICASPDYISNAGTPKTPEDLIHHECLGFTNWHSQGGWQLIQKKLGTKSRNIPRFESDNGQALLTAAVKGIGIVMMPRELMRQDIQAERLIELMKEHAPPARPIYAVYPSERQLAPKLTSFVDYLLLKLRKS